MKITEEMVLFNLLFLLPWMVSGTPTEDPLAQTPLGKVRGYRMTSRAGRRFLAFSGIPYAKPPVGELRFEPPVPLDPWPGCREALEDGPRCVQFNLFSPNPQAVGLEDCLYLSLYTHKLNGSSPVLVHFHGGAFISGNGARITGPQYLMDEDLVVVNVNYRLSMFGFLSFEDMDMPGNQGMKDQTMALKWIKQNIASFGGDPNRVTLVGESAGGVSVCHHIVSPLSKGLFQGGIAESGTSYSGGALAPPGAARNTSAWLLSLVGCGHATTKEAVACLRKVEAKELATQITRMRGWQGEIYAYFIPVIEPPHPGAFLVGPISEWKHSPVPLILGTSSAEGLLKTLYMEYVNMSYEWYYNNFEDVAPRSLLITGYSSEPQEVVKSIKHYYFPEGEINWANLTMIYGDSIITVGVVDGANKHTGDVYMYHFDYLGYYSLAGDEKIRNDSLIIGAFHTDEIIYLWYNKDYGNLQGKDLGISKKMVEMWANFARDGKPTKPNIGFHWNKWTAGCHSYLDINKDGFKMQDKLAKDRYEFWQTLKYRDNMK